MEKKITAYLLGELPEEEQLQLEQQYFSNAAMFEQFLAEEEDLIYAYVYNELSPQQRQHFEKHFLQTPNQKERVKIAQAVVNYLAQRQVKKQKNKPWWRSVLELFRTQSFLFQLSFAMAALVLIALSGLLLLEMIRLRTQVAQLQAQHQPASRPQPDPKLQEQIANEHARAEQLAEQLRREQEQRTQLERELQSRKNQPNTTPPISDVVSFFLPPVTVRGGGNLPKLTIPTGTTTVQLTLGLLTQENYTSFQARIFTDEPTQIWTKSGLKGKGTGERKTVTLNVPAKTFNSGDYLIQLIGVSPTGESEELGDYPLTVQKN